MRKMSLRDLIKTTAAKPKEFVQAVKDPMKRFKVHFDRYRVWCVKPTGETSVIEWRNLTTILHDSMPGHNGTLSLWVLQGTNQLCVIPEGSLGLDDLIAKLRQIPGFKLPDEGEAEHDGDRVTVTCWQKPEKGEKA
jgi:hypothetical protein